MLFFSLPRGILQDHNATFWIETEYLPNRFMPLDEFVDSKLEGLYNGQADVLSRDTIDIAGQTAERVELSCCNSDRNLHEVRIFLINDELGYNLVYSAAPVSFFPLFSADAGNVVESFRLLNRSDIVRSEDQTSEQTNSLSSWFWLFNRVSKRLDGIVYG